MIRWEGFDVGVFDIYDRANTKEISNFILDGETNYNETDDKITLQERMEKVKTEREQLVGNLDADIADKVLEITEKYRKTYFEAGIKCGMKLFKNILK